MPNIVKLIALTLVLQSLAIVYLVEKKEQQDKDILYIMKNQDDIYKNIYELRANK